MAQGYTPKGTLSQGSDAKRPLASTLPNNFQPRLTRTSGTGEKATGAVYPLRMAKLPKPQGQ